MPGPMRCIVGHNVKLDGCGMRRKMQQRFLRRRQLVMIREQKSWRRTALWSITRIRDRSLSYKIGPAVPRALVHLKEHVGYVSHRTAATIIRPLIDCEQSAVRKEPKSVGVSQSPCDQL